MIRRLLLWYHSVQAATVAVLLCFPGSVLLFGTCFSSFRDPSLRFIRVLRLRCGVRLLSGRREF